MLGGDILDRIKLRLGLKTKEEIVDRGLRSMRDLLDRIGEHDTAMMVDDMVINGSMLGKCLLIRALDHVLPLLTFLHERKMGIPKESMKDLDELILKIKRDAG